MGKKKELKEKSLKEKPIENESVAPDGSRGGGNTKTPPPRSNCMKNWFFTLNNYTQEECGSIKQILESLDGAKFHVGFEKGSKEETPHLQGFVMLKSKARLNELIGNKRIHWEKLKGTEHEAYTYCNKEGNPMCSKGMRKPIVDEFLKLTPKDWQLEILTLLKTEPDPRKIYVYIDEIGGSGKSIFTKHICLNFTNAIKVTGKGNDVKFMIASALEEREIECVIWDLPRDCAEYISYSALEEIKDGHICSGKYESKSIIFNRPHVIIFTNTLPITEKLSADRWVIKYIQKKETISNLSEDLELNEIE